MSDLRVHFSMCVFVQRTSSMNDNGQRQSTDKLRRTKAHVKYEINNISTAKPVLIK